MPPNIQNSYRTDAQLDRLLEALRATGTDSYRADPDRLDRWCAFCPGCASELIGVRSLSICESRAGRVTVECWRGCPAWLIMGAHKLAERRYPAGWRDRESPGDQVAVAEVLLDQYRAERRIVVALRREAA